MNRRGDAHDADPPQRHPPSPCCRRPYRDAAEAAASRNNHRESHVQNKTRFFRRDSRGVAALQRGDVAVEKGASTAASEFTQNGRRSTSSSSAELGEESTNRVRARRCDRRHREPMAWPHSRWTAEVANRRRDLFCWQAVRTGVTQRCPL